MRLLENSKYVVEKKVIEDGLRHENAAVVIDEPYAAVIKIGGWYKCVFDDLRDYSCFGKKYGLHGDVCLMGAPQSATNGACITYAYLDPMPPEPRPIAGMEIKRLAPSLAGVVLDAYHNPGGGYTVDSIAELMRLKGVFGAIVGGKLAGFIGRHGDGSMGMLEVFEPFRRRGIAAELEKFLITYVMTFGRTPFCDVFTDNPVSLALQSKIGLVRGCGYTYWMDTEKDRVPLWK